MDILSAPDLASKPRSGNARRALDRETFTDVLPMPNNFCHRHLARTKQIHGHKKQKSMPAGPRIG
jgi:hypothetical protein